MADEQKKQGNQPGREGQRNDPNRNDPSRQEQGGQKGSEREQSTTTERPSERSTGTNGESRNRPEGDVEGVGTQSNR